jgi:hypothetical protein
MSPSNKSFGNPGCGEQLLELLDPPTSAKGLSTPDHPMQKYWPVFRSAVTEICSVFLGYMDQRPEMVLIGFTQLLVPELIWNSL